jgi:Family of unknown function (DUF6331)
MQAIDIPEPLSWVIQSCEVRCVAGCCGLEAFDIHPQWIRAWMESNDPALLSTALEQISVIIEDLSGIQRNFYFPMLNHTGSTDHWITLLTEWKAAMEKAPYTPLPALPQSQSPDQTFRSQVLETLALLGCGVIGVTPIVGAIWLFHLGHGIFVAASIAGIIVLIYWLWKRS